MLSSAASCAVESIAIPAANQFPLTLVLLGPSSGCCGDEKKIISRWHAAQA